ncbi:family 78 glycoside hydrolase catalytic domain [Gemmatimonadota bacterium]
MKKKPSEFIIHVSADNRYKLFVNGEQAGDGPARGDLDHWRFETYDLAPYLQEGDNLLAAVVWNFGEHLPWAQMTHSTAFLVQGNSTAESVVNTDQNWKVAENRAYSPLPINREKVPAFCVVGPGDRVDGSLYPWAWEQPEFDDSDWTNAVSILRPQATPRKMRDGDGHWSLVPRMIPPMEKNLENPLVIRRSAGIELGKDYLWQTRPLTIPPESRISLLIDRQHLTTAYPELRVSGGKGAKITLTYAEALFDEHRQKGHRDKIDNMRVLGYSDEFLPDGSPDRLFSTLWFRTYRYIQLEVETSDNPLTLYPLQSRFVGYPFQAEASFTSDDPSLEKIWEVGWRTARLCAIETYVDCPYYEQLNYVGDTRIQALISLYVSGDDRLMRKAITQFDDSRIPDGLTQSRYPSYIRQIIPPYSLFWIAMIYDHWTLRNDPEFVGSFLPGVRGVLEWFERHLTENGLLGHLPWWNFVDWTPEYPNGVPPGAEEGENAVISLQYVYALQYAAELFEAFGKPAEAENYRLLAERVGEAVMKHCWSAERGLIAETPEKKMFSQHANVMAILVDLVPEQEQTALFERLNTEKDLVQCTFYYRFYLLEALKKVGRGDEYLKLLKPWHEMLEIGLTTFAEKPEPTRSDCHAWSASPLYGLLSTVCGIEPAAAGFSRVRIAPHLGYLKKVEVSMPHPSGKIKCSLSRDGSSGIRGEVDLPDGLDGEFFWNDRKIELHPGKQTIELP